MKAALIARSCLAMKRAESIVRLLLGLLPLSPSAGNNRSPRFERVRQLLQQHHAQFWIGHDKDQPRQSYMRRNITNNASSSLPGYP